MHGSQTVVLPVLGMTCAACQHHVQEALAGAAGVRVARVDFMRHRALAAVDALAELQPAEAGVRRPGPVGSPEAGYVEEMMPLDRVGVGDVVVILPGKRVVGDGGG